MMLPLQGNGRASKRLREETQIDYALIIDADDALVCEQGFDPAAFKSGLVADLYHVACWRGPIRHYRPQICSNRLAFRYRGVLHEFGETTRFVAVLEVFVGDVRIVQALELRCLVTENPAPDAFGLRVLLEEGNKLTRLRDRACSDSCEATWIAIASRSVWRTRQPGSTL